MFTLVTNSLTNSLTHSLLFRNLIDVTLACEDAYSKLVEVVNLADVSDVMRIVLATIYCRFGS